MKDLKILIFGTSEFGIPFFEEIYKHYNIVGVVTKPDTKKGRNLRIQASPVKLWAFSKNLKVFSPEDLKDETFINEVNKTDCDIILLISYGKILPIEILKIPKLVAMNLHPSLLPLYRGAAPIERQLMDGVSESGITIIKMDESIDGGEIILQKKVFISFEDDKKSFVGKLIEAGKSLLIEAIEEVTNSSYTLKSQIGEGSYAKKVLKSDEKINWSDSAINIYNKIKALSPNPSCFTIFRGKKLKIIKAHLEKSKEIYKKYGEITLIENKKIAIQTKDDLIIPLIVQLEGKKPVDIKDFINGYSPKTEEILS